jgi:PKD repeat protein/subtilisin family serine protease
MKYFKPLFLSFAIVFFSGIMAYGDSRLSTSEGASTYPVVFGERPPIDLNSLPDDAWELGRLKIKLTPEMGRSIPPEPIVAGSIEYVITGNHSLDALNQTFNVKSYQPLFAPLYQTGTRSTAFAARHEAWGFHLWFELIVDEETIIIDAVKAFAALPEVAFAEPEYRKRLVIDDPGFGYPDPVKIPDATAGERWTPNDPQYSNQWHYNNTGQQNGTPGADISLQDAWAFEKGNENIIVAIVDGGIDYAHSDLAGNMWSGIGYNFVTNSANVTPHNHGTHVAGTVAAVSNNNVGVAGVAGGTGSGNGVRLMSCQVFTTSSNGGFALAPVYAADNGASISQNSWGYTNPGVYEQSVLNAIDYFNINGGGLAMSGGITIFAAGNGNSTGQWYPGYYSGCFSVAGTNNQDQKSWYSNFDTWIDISAPGGETNQVSARGVLSTLNNNSYGYYQGTSMACPHASGVAALMISYAFGQLSATDVADILRNTTDDHYAVNPGFIGQLGTGRLNANAAMLYVDGLMSGVLNPVSFTATALNDEDIALSWIKNPANDSVVIAWSPDGIFGTPVNGKNYQPGHSIPGGGLVIYFGADDNTVHERLDHSTTYYYRAFSKNTQIEYSTGVSASATTMAAPHADFVASPTIAMLGETITFTDASYPGNFNTYVWDFGNGAAPATATGAGPHSVIYNTTGSKTVSLTVDGTLTETKENYITITSVIYSTSATYTSGHISTDRNFTTLPGASNCPATLTLNIPEGAVITSTDVSYQMTALNSGWKSEQRSLLRCVSDGGTSEEQLFTGTGNSIGTQAYNRTGLGIANDVLGGGDIAFEMHAGRTWGGSGCNPTYNRVDNNTWSITLHYILTDLPEADFSASDFVIFEGETVDFFDLSTNEPNSWSWSFEGGTPASSNLQNPSITYAEAGVFDVSLTVANAFGTDTETKTGFITVEVMPLPEADFTASSTIIFEGETVAFFDLSTNEPTSWSWSFEGGTPASSNLQNPSITYAEAGVYDVSLTVANAFGTDTETKTGFITVEVMPLPEADFSASSTIIYEGETVAFFDLSTNEPTSWSWSFEGGTPASSNLQNPSITYAEAGVYDVSLTVANAFGTDTETKTGFITVEVMPLPEADFTASDFIIFEGETVDFFDLSTNAPTSWSWSFEGGTPASSNLQNPSITYAEAGVYDVSLTVANAFGTDTETKTGFITVEVMPLPEADFSASDFIIFEGETVDFFDLSTNEPTSWSWSFEGGTPASSNLQNPSITYAEAGVYDVSLTVANAFGTDTETKTGFITVNSQQQTIADFTADNTLIEQGDVVHFFDLSTGGPTFWHWQIQGASPAISYKKNPVVIFNQVGVFNVQLTVSGPNGQDTKLKEGYIEVTEVNCPFPPGWEHEPTSTMHVIAVTLESNPRLFESPLEAGDFVGVFYHDDNGELKCGGACQWDGTENIAVTAFGNNFFTPFKDGFDVNETFHWKIYSMEKSLSFDAVSSYDDQTPYQEKFFPMGMSALTDLYAGVLFEVTIPQGWSGISSPLLPVPMSMDDMFAAVQQDLSILYNFDGMYWPGENINTLGQWEINGYTIKMDNSATFEFAGDYMRNPVYQINTGTVYLPVLSPCEVDVESLFAPHLNHLFLVRNITGTAVYWPALGINTIGSFIPGRSYLVLSTGDYNLAFPECEPAKKAGLTPDGNQGFIETPWGQIAITPQVHTVGLTASADDILQPGDIIGIFTKDGTIAGSAHYQGNNLVIPVFGNDITTAAQDGFVNGEPMHLKAFRPTEEVEFDLDAVWELTMPDQELFNAGGVSVIPAFKPPDNVNEHFATSGQILIYPNPGSGVINISGLDDTQKLTIMQPDGLIIATLTHDGGNHKSIDLSGLPAGLYLVRTAGSYGFRVNKFVIE